jgi:hypothetical protein
VVSGGSVWRLSDRVRGVSNGQAVLWALGGLALVVCLIFLAIFVKFVTKATVSYLRSKPYPALATFALPGGLAAFIASFLGTAVPVGALIGFGVGAAVLLLVAMELGAD